MASSTRPSVAFIGFGEVGQTFTKGLRAAGVTAIAAHDRLFGDAAGARLELAAATLGVATHAALAPALTGADIVYSAVTASEAEAVARAAAEVIEQGQLFVDVNSAAPETKKRAAALIEAAGGRYLEAAVMAPVMKPGLAVPILAGGPHAAGAAARLNPLGMNLTAVSDVFGRASAMKLCRSLIIKGLEALMVDCARASGQAGVTDEVYASLAATFPSIDWHDLADKMAERVATHGIRRAAEMREAADMLEEMGLDGALARAVASAQENGARRRMETRP